MNKALIVDEILNDYIKKGCSSKTIEEIRPIILNIVENFKDQTPKECIEQIISNLEQETKKFLSEKNSKDINLIYGISSGILASGNKNWSILLYGGKTNYDEKYEVSEKTPFDIASVSKLYTLVLKDKLVEEGYFKDTDKIINLIPEFINMDDFTLEDLSLLCGELRTNGRLDNAKSQKEALQMLKEIYVYSNDRTVNKYSDFGAIITAMVITEIFNKINGTNYNFDEILSKIIFDKYDMNHTYFNPQTNIIVAGNGNEENSVHDPKTRILGGVSGAAGLFSTPLDQIKFAKAMFKGNSNDYDFINDPVSPENIKKYGTIAFPNSPQSNKGHFGLYVKNSDPAKFFCPQDYSDGTFAHQGWTGPYVVFDPNNQVHNSIFVSAVRPDLATQLQGKEDIKEYLVNDKPAGYMNGFHAYQDAITKNTLIIKALKDYLDKCYEDCDLEIKVKVR